MSASQSGEPSSDRPAKKRKNSDPMDEPSATCLEPLKWDVKKTTRNNLGLVTTIYSSEKTNIELRDLQSQIEADNFPHVPGRVYYMKGCVKNAIVACLNVISEAMEKKVPIVIFEALPGVGKSTLSQVVAAILCHNESTIIVDHSSIQGLKNDQAVRCVDDCCTSVKWPILDQANVNLFNMVLFLDMALDHLRIHGTPYIIFTSGHYPPNNSWLNNRAIKIVVFDLVFDKDFVEFLLETKICTLEQLKCERQEIIGLILKISRRAAHIKQMLYRVSFSQDLNTLELSEIETELVNLVYDVKDVTSV